MSQVWDGEWGSEQILVSYAGLEPKLKATLERLGHKVKMAGERPGNLPRPQRPESGGQQPDDAVLDFIRRRKRGIIRYDPARVQVERLVAQVAEAFPKQSLLVVARRQNDVRRIAAHLEDCGVDVGQFIPHSAGRGHQRVAVTTNLGVSVQTRPQFRDIAVYVDPAELMDWFGRGGVGHLHHARVFGLVPYGLQPPSPVREFVGAVFGEDSVSVPHHGWDRPAGGGRLRAVPLAGQPGSRARTSWPSAAVPSGTTPSATTASPIWRTWSRTGVTRS